LFEKIEVEWFTAEDMVSRRSQVRGFYQEIVDKILADKVAIRAFLRKCMGNRAKTQKRKSAAV
jgi:hypothetical protein